MPNTGLYLAELRNGFHEYRTPYLTWAETYGQPQEVALAHYRRALIGLYEARIHASDPYTGEAYHYLTTAADVYFSGKHGEIAQVTNPHPLLSDTGTVAQNPLHHLPRPVLLGDLQQVMLRQFHEMGTTCRELLLLTDYHDINDTRVAELVDYDGQTAQVAVQRRKCLLMVRERWQSSGITDPLLVPGPDDEEFIDRYYRGELSMAERWEVEARRPTDSVFRAAMELREDWRDVLTVAGRQDLMETLEREEARYAQISTPAPATAPPDVQLTPRRKRGKIPLPGLGYILTVVLFLVLGYLVWDTLGTTAPDRTYEAYFDPFPNLYRDETDLNEDERDLNGILTNYYDRGYYQRAYEELLPTAQAYPAAALYLGVSALELDNPDRAQQWFAQIEPGSPFREAADWYEALAFLAQRRRPAALSILSEIVGRRGHTYRRQAERLLEELV